jgi:hypothetical protein
MAPDRLLIFVSKTNEMKVYEGKAESEAGKLTFTQSTNLPDGVGGMLEPNVIWDKTVSELALCQGYQKDDKQEMYLHRFGKYLQQSSKQHLTDLGYGYPAMAICQNVLSIAACPGPEITRVLVRKVNNQWTKVILKSTGTSESNTINNDLNFFCPDGGNFKYVYNVQRISLSSTLKREIHLETMTFDNFSQLSTDPNITWTRFNYSNWNKDTQDRVAMVVPSQLMLYDENKREHWLYFISLDCSDTSAGKWKVIYFRVPLKSDGSLSSFPDLTISDETSLDFGWNPVTNPWHELPRLSSTIFNGRVWIFFGDKDGGKNYSCPVPKDAKLPNSTNGWTKNPNTMANITNATVNCSFVPVKVPGEFLG